MKKEGEKKMKDNLARKIELTEDLVPKKVSYYDILNLKDDKRYELIDGKKYLMSSPSVIHQEILGEIYSQIREYLKGKKCKVFVAPLDVKISGEKEDKKAYNVVQPDIMVVCDSKKIKESNILGAPDMVIEILSNSTAGHDRILKLNLYQKYGVKEYWIVSPNENVITVFLLNEEKQYTVKAYYLDDKLKVNVLKDCYVNLKEFCKENDIIIKRGKEKENED